MLQFPIRIHALVYVGQETILQVSDKACFLENRTMKIAHHVSALPLAFAKE